MIDLIMAALNWARFFIVYSVVCVFLFGLVAVAVMFMITVINSLFS